MLKNKFIYLAILLLVFVLSSGAYFAFKISLGTTLSKTTVDGLNLAFLDNPAINGKIYTPLSISFTVPYNNCTIVGNSTFITTGGWQVIAEPSGYVFYQNSGVKSIVIN